MYQNKSLQRLFVSYVRYIGSQNRKHDVVKLTNIFVHLLGAMSSIHSGSTAKSKMNLLFYGIKKQRIRSFDPHCQYTLFALI